jgi:hypothetical protein
MVSLRYLTCLEGETLTAKLVHYRQYLELVPRIELIGQKVHRSALIRPSRLRSTFILDYAAKSSQSGFP